MTNGLAMGSYIDDLNEEDLGLTAPEHSEDMDIPLLGTVSADAYWYGEAAASQPRHSHVYSGDSIRF